ncbi:uncharacterized protein [Ranitomeya imitator]|uniref:uncharacterized protein isoform X6 n=1 Tax=Ranitomeya imitator TaxID=111125 RepID=UPI0037E9B655
MEEWEYLEGHQDRYQNVMMEERRPLTPRDGSRRGNPPENHNISEDHQGEDLIDINVEVKDEVEETMDVWADQQDGSRRRNPPERCPRPLYPQDCPEKNRNIPEDHQREDLISIKVEENLEEAMRGGQPCMNVVKEETPDVTTELRMMGSQETCPLCSCEVEDDGERVVIGAKGAEGINNASIERGVSTVVAAGAVVHKRCRMNYINKKQIELHKKATSVHRSPAKRAFYSNMSSTEDLAQSGQDTNEMSDSEGSSSSSVSAVFSQSESSDPEPARPPPKKVSKKSKQPTKKRRNIAVVKELLDIENETLIALVEANPSIWDQSDSSHNDIIKNRKLWDKIICQLDPQYLHKSASSKKKIADAVHTRWRSIRDRFVRDLRNSQNTPSGSGGKRVTPYVHYEQLLFLQKTSQRSMICSTAAPREAEESEPSQQETSQQTGTEDLSGLSEPRSMESSTVAPVVSARLQAYRRRKRSSAKDEVDATIVDRLQRLEDLCRSEHRHLRREFSKLQSRESVYAANEWKLLFLSYVPVAQKIPPHRNLMFRQRFHDLFQEFLAP